MGAAVSVQQLYVDAVEWFKQYFDTEMYIADFRSIDRDQNGGVDLGELQRWLTKKAFKDGGSWKVFLLDPEVIALAHEQACVKKLTKRDSEAGSVISAASTGAPTHQSVSHGTTTATSSVGEGHAQSQTGLSSATVGDSPATNFGRFFGPGSHVNQDEQFIFDLAEFRLLLQHLFTLSILWVHFQNADNWEAGQDMGNLLLSLKEFKLANRTLAQANMCEEPSDEQLHRDFSLLDSDNSGTLSFVEVCRYCVNYMDKHLHPSGFQKVEEVKDLPYDLLNDLSHVSVKTEFAPQLRGHEPGAAARRMSGHNFSPAHGQHTQCMIHSQSASDTSAPVMEKQRKPSKEFTLIEKNERALLAVQHALVHNRQGAEFVAIKMDTEATLDALTHPASLPVTTVSTAASPAAQLPSTSTGGVPSTGNDQTEVSVGVPDNDAVPVAASIDLENAEAIMSQNPISLGTES